MSENLWFPDDFRGNKIKLIHLSLLNIRSKSRYRSLRNRDPKRLPLPKICPIYPTMMKLDKVIPYLKKFLKTYKSRGTPFYFC